MIQPPHGPLSEPLAPADAVGRSRRDDRPTAVSLRPRLRGVLHGVAAIVSIQALVWLVKSASSAEAVIAAWVYGIAGLLCYLTSSLYHLIVRSERAKRALRRADHAMIYVLIAGTATPVCLLALTGWWRWLVLALFWLGALAGVALAVAPHPVLPRFRIALYLILGWLGVTALPALADHPLRAMLVVAAGLLYTAGAASFGSKRPRLHPGWFGYHEFWHGVGLAAGCLLFAVNLSLIASAAP